jgi:hypothetical protein
VRAVISEDQLIPGIQQIRTTLTSALGESPSDQIEGLIYAVASINTQLNHERVYQTIFGSQINALSKMNTDFGATRESLEPIYNAAKAANPVA